MVSWTFSKHLFGKLGEYVLCSTPSFFLVPVMPRKQAPAKAFLSRFLLGRFLPSCPPQNPLPFQNGHNPQSPRKNPSQHRDALSATVTTFVKTKAQAAKADMATTQPADKQTSQASKVVRLLATQDLKPLEESSAVREKG